MQSNRIEKKCESCCEPDAEQSDGEKCESYCETDAEQSDG